MDIEVAGVLNNGSGNLEMKGDDLNFGFGFYLLNPIKGNMHGFDPQLLDISVKIMEVENVTGIKFIKTVPLITCNQLHEKRKDL